MFDLHLQHINYSHLGVFTELIRDFGKWNRFFLLVTTMTFVFHIKNNFISLSQASQDCKLRNYGVSMQKSLKI